MECEFTLPRDFGCLLHAAIVAHLKPGAASDAYIPEPEELETVLQVALWASVLRVEDRPVAFTINLRPGNVPSRAIPLERHIELSAAQLARLSIGTLPGVSAVHVGRGDRKLEIFGIDTMLRNASLVRLEVRGPATIAIKAAMSTVAFLYGNEAELLDPAAYAKYLFVDETLTTDHEGDAERERRFFDIARAMHGRGQGGTLLVLSSKDAEVQLSELAESLEPHYELVRPFDGLREVEAEQNAILSSLQAAASGGAARALLARLRAVELLHSQYLAGLVRTTAIDGASVVSAEGALLAFGCKVLLTNTPRVWRSRPTKTAPSLVDITDFGGTRHQSAARFVGSHPGTRAVIASQDGTVSILNHASLGEVDCLEHAEWAF